MKSNDNSATKVKSTVQIAFENKFSSSISSTRKVQLASNLKWKQHATTIAGGNERRNQVNQLSVPEGIHVDNGEQVIYIADYGNHRIVTWSLGANIDQISAIGNGKGKNIDQLSFPTNVIVDQKTKSLIICDSGNRRVIRWSMKNQHDKEIIISDISCYGLMMNDRGDLFVSDIDKHEVKRWKKGEKEGTVVAGGNEKGVRLDQFNQPAYIFVDRNDTVYVLDMKNHRVMKWMKGAEEGIVVAGEQDQRNHVKQLSNPEGMIVNNVGDVFVSDSDNHRIICWSLGSKEGRVIVGGNGWGQGSNQLNYPKGLSFDSENNLYVVDCLNNRIQRFDID